MSTINNNDLFLISSGGVNYKVTAADVAAYAGAGATFGLGLNLTGGIVKVSLPIASTPPAVGAAAAQAINGSIYWDDNLGQLFIRYANSGGGGGPVWVAAAPPAGGGGGVTSVGVTAPITNTGTATAPVIAISTATTTARGAVQLATAAEAATGTDASKVLTPATGVPKTPADMTGALYLPGGNDGARPAAATGLLRYNSQGGTPVDLEYYDGAAWTQLATGGGGGTLFAFATFDAGFTVLKSANFASITVTTTAPGLYPNLYTATFTNSPPDANYAVLVTSKTPTVIGNYFTTTTSGFQMTFNAIGTGIITNVTSPFSVAVII